MRRGHRDNQRKRVYDAERTAFTGHERYWEAFHDISPKHKRELIGITQHGLHLPREQLGPRFGPGSYAGEFAPGGDLIWYRWNKIEPGHRIWHPGALRTIAECQAYVDHVTTRLGHGTGGWITVTSGKGARWAKARYGLDRTINLPLWARTRHVILHEIAHHMNRLGASHGPEFTREYLDLVRRFLGPVQASRLLAEFRAKRVKVGPAARSVVAASKRK